jgi:hypothetical protein
MAYLNKIDINGRTYYLQHLTDGKYEAKLPELEKDSTLVVQDYNSSSGNVGDSDTPVYIEKNKIKPLSSNIGGEKQFVYMKRGSITASTSTVGSNTKPVYMNNGKITEFVNTIGSGVKPVYMNNGEITESDDTVGSATKPIYLNSGVITACDTIPIESGGTGATTAAEARTKLGVTPANIGAAESEHTHNDLNTKSVRVLLGSEAKNHWLRPQRVENNHYALGSATNYWDAAYVNKISANGSELEIIDDLKVKPTGVDRAAIRIDLPIDDSGNYAREYMLLWQESNDTQKEPVAKFGLGSGSAGSSNVSIKNEMKLYADRTTLRKPLTIESGGTGATNKEEALINLGLTATAEELNGHETRIGDMEVYLENLSNLEVVDASGDNYDMDVIFTSGEHCKIYETDGDTKGTPYKYEVSSFKCAYILSVSASLGNGKQIAYTNGGDTFERRLVGGEIGDWIDITNSVACNNGAGVVRLTSERNTNKDGYNYYLRPLPQDENYTYTLGSSGRHWNNAYIDKLMVENGLDESGNVKTIEIKSWVTSQIQAAIDATWEASY